MNHSAPTPHHEVIIIGGGQAGLSAAWHCREAGLDHLVLERHERFHAWKQQRWDSFCLVTPNWQCQLPGYNYTGSDPHGFMVKADIIDFVEAYAESFAPPILEHVEVTSLSQEGGKFHLTTSAGPFTAHQVVIATGGYHIPITPRMAERLPPTLLQLHANEYRNPAQLPPGRTLIIGTGQSGCQIAEDLHLAGRQVHLAVGSAPRVARFYRGRDIVDWLQDMGHYDIPVTAHPMQEGVRGKANHYVTGRDGGRDIDLRRFAAEGMALHGHLTEVDGNMLGFAPDLAENLDRADAVSERIKDSIDAYIENEGITAPAEPRYVPVWQPPAENPPLDLAAAGITSLIWCVGYRPDYAWVHAPVFTGAGMPVHLRGVTPVPGLYFLGLPWLNTWGSGRFAAIARDAAHLATHIVAQAQRATETV
jgi:putative flavoprotein involved in K+ transport